MPKLPRVSNKISSSLQERGSRRRDLQLELRRKQRKNPPKINPEADHAERIARLYRPLPARLNSLFSFQSDETYLSLLAEAASQVRKLKVASLDNISFDWHTHGNYISLDEVLRDTLYVAQKGSPKAAYLFLTRLARTGSSDISGNAGYLLLKNSREISSAVTNNPLSRLLRPIILSFDSRLCYVNIGRHGLEDLLLALDQEEREDRREHYLTSEHYKANTHLTFLETPLRVMAFAKDLGLGAQPSSAAEILLAVQICHRNPVFQTLEKDPGLVNLYENLKLHGVEAKDYAYFVSDVAAVEVQFGGKQTTLKEIVSGLSSDENHRSGAAWLVSHPGVWPRSDLAQVIGLAGTSYAKMKLELYSKWRSDSVKGSVVLELAPMLSLQELAELAEALPKIDSNDITLLSTPTLDGILALQKPEQNLEGVSGLVERRNRDNAALSGSKVLWASVAYPNNPNLVSAVSSAYEVVPAHRQHRLREVATFVSSSYKHQSRAAREVVLLDYFSKISGMTPLSASYIFGSLDDSLFSLFLRRLPEEGFVEKLETAVSESSNPYPDLSGVIISDSRPVVASALGRFEDDGVNIPSLNSNLASGGVVYKMVIIGRITGRAQETARRRLLEENIEPVFLQGETRGLPPHCHAVLIFPGGGTPHSSATRDYYRRHNYPTVTIAGGYGASSVINSALTVRNRLASKLSA